MRLSDEVATLLPSDRSCKYLLQNQFWVEVDLAEPRGFLGLFGIGALCFGTLGLGIFRAFALVMVGCRKRTSISHAVFPGTASRLISVFLPKGGGTATPNKWGLLQIKKQIRLRLANSCSLHSIILCNGRLLHKLKHFVVGYATKAKNDIRFSLRMS